MSTPEEVLESAMAVRWPGQMPEAEYGAAIRLMLDMGALLRPQGPTRRARRVSEAAPEEGVPHAIVRPEGKGAHILRLLSDGRPWTTSALARATNSSTSGVILVARAAGATQSRPGPGPQLTWQLTSPAAPAVRGQRRPMRRGILKPERKAAIIERMASALAKGPISLPAFSRDVGITSPTARRIAVDLGARKSATKGNNVVWSLKPPETQKEADA